MVKLTIKNTIKSPIKGMAVYNLMITSKNLPLTEKLKLCIITVFMSSMQESHVSSFLKRVRIRLFF